MFVFNIQLESYISKVVIQTEFSVVNVLKLVFFVTFLFRSRFRCIFENLCYFSFFLIFVKQSKEFRNISTLLYYELHV